MNADIALAARMLISRCYPVCMTGAGMSVDSGIRPFRGPGGIWTEFGEPPLDDFDRFRKDPVAYWEDLLNCRGPVGELYRALVHAQPHVGYYALADLEKSGIVKFTITQNIDALHRKAGSERLAEIHGSYDKVRCPRCGRRWMRQEVRVDRLPPRCSNCGDVLKSDIVVFGEPIPSDVVDLCLTEVSRADAMLLVGTSAYVYPAAGFPRQVKARGGTLIEIGPYDTEITDMCDIVVRGTAADVLPRLAAEVLGCNSGLGWKVTPSGES
ncbi:MAG TPA: NAD-dependent protein deacylase [Dehalococcoidia bacterium]|nr:NAD-dependent protein deacylase [Dehalococcoidia bacterium]